MVHSYSAMDGCTTINFVKHVKIGFVQVGDVLLHDGICGSFHIKATINAYALAALCNITKLG